jgi:hypothetical protein
MKKTILTVLISSITIFSYSQEEKELKWSLSIHSGLAVPVGGFATVSPEKTAKLEPNGSGPYFSGFTREGSSAAKTGFSFAITAAYQWIRPCKISAAFGKTVNEVNTQPVTDYLLNVLLSPTNLVATNYEFTQGTIGIDYCHRFGRLTIEAGPRFGLSYLLFPEYTLIGIVLTNATKQHYGPKPVSNSAVVGGSANVSYGLGKRFYLGMGAIFLSSNFDYTVDLRSRGVSNEIYSDKITYRVLSVNLNVGYRF